jgi:transposase
MQTQRTELNFEGQNFYVGIDVHLKTWTVSIMSEQLMLKTFTQPAQPDKLLNYLVRNYPGGTYHSVYEAGFSGFWSHYKLKEMGINNIVINPADVPTTQKEHLLKDDPTDSRKLARSLRSGVLRAIYVPEPLTMEDRSLVRTRSALVKDMGRYKSRIKSQLNLYGITYPEEFEKSGTHWSKRFLKWLNGTDFFQSDTGALSLRVKVQEAEQQRQLILDTTRAIRKMSQGEKYASNMKLLTTIPGVGLITAITFLTEIENIERFTNSDHFAGFIGLIPNRHSSGAKESTGEMTFRGHENIKKMLIESSWIAARCDPALTLSYHKYTRRMESNKAIVKIARKLLNRIFYVLTFKKEYVPCVVK